MHAEPLSGVRVRVRGRSGVLTGALLLHACVGVYGGMRAHMCARLGRRRPSGRESGPGWSGGGTSATVMRESSTSRFDESYFLTVARTLGPKKRA